MKKGRRYLHFHPLSEARLILNKPGDVTFGLRPSNGGIFQMMVDCSTRMKH